MVTEWGGNRQGELQQCFFISILSGEGWSQNTKAVGGQKAESQHSRAVVWDDVNEAA